MKVCHPDARSRHPDCYRRVTVYHEDIGALKDKVFLPSGVEDIIDAGWRAWVEMVRLGEELQ